MRGSHSLAHSHSWECFILHYKWSLFLFLIACSWSSPLSCVTGDECRLLVLRPTHVCGNGCRKGRCSCSPPSCLWTPGPPRIPCLPPIVAYHPSETHFAGRSCSALDRVPPSPQPCSSEDLTAQKGQGETGQALLCMPPPALIVDQIPLSSRSPTQPPCIR